MSRQAVLVTGSGRGIGLAIAVHLARKGFSIALNDYADGEQLQAAEETIRAVGSVDVVRIAGDVSDIAGHGGLIERAEAALGPLTTLVNNAGVSVLSRGDILDVTEASYDRCMAVNAKAHFFLSQAFARRVLGRERQADAFYSIVNVTSSNAVAVSVARAEYCTSKAAAAMISRAFAVRLGTENIAVFDIQPGLIETDMTMGVKDTYQRRIDEDGLTVIPRLGKPDDIGRMVATLATGGVPYVTGQVISADGGMLISRF
jgi:NAD(P)-dependent dehydrogenase (short-subunit alcohol dehydrogenase family)